MGCDESWAIGVDDIGVFAVAVAVVVVIFVSADIIQIAHIWYEMSLLLFLEQPFRNTSH